MEVSLRGIRGHTGTRAPAGDLSGRLFKARDALEAIFASTLRLNSPDDWRTQVRFPFVHVGELGIFNVAAAQGTLGIEIRPIPGEDIGALLQRTRVYCFDAGLDLRIIASEPGVTCQPENPYLGRLIEAVRETSGREPVLGKKLPATSARFAPRGAGVVWGQTGIGPHAPDERHFIPSILPYYRALDVLADKCPAASAESP